MLRITAILSVLLLTSAAHAQPEQAKLLDFFEVKVRPVLAKHCFECHGAQKPKGGVRLDRKEFVFKKRAEPLVVPGHPEKSLIVQAIRHEIDAKMPPPPKAKLPAQAIDDITTWIKLGASWPDEKPLAKEVDSRNHWAFQPVKKPTPPTVKRKEWQANPIDAFILAKLESKGLTPNASADPRTLLRRVYFDLIGLPPTYAEVEAFAKECAATSQQAALEKVVDRLLARPQYGERWARHWLDVARYADTKGYVFQEERKYAYSYTYRDYVIKAFNDDLPYDLFILQQLAADRLVALDAAPPEAQAAMGYLTLGRRFLNNIHDITDDRIDVVTRGMLGLTVTCARCHDHKYDPISIKDYYGLYGVFTSSIEPKDLPLLGEPEKTTEYVAFKKKLDELEKVVADFKTKNQKELAAKNRKFRDELAGLQRKVDAHKANSPGAPPRGMVMVDRPNPGDARVLLRGNPNNPGAIVPRQFLPVLVTGKPKPFGDGSGRLELARAIADPKNPLTARVFVNRVWLQYFGSGLVTSPSNFGIRAEPPSHPELLDYLAATFVEEGWSIKKLHRRIVLSKVYQLSSAENVKAREVDAENRLLARANRRRLDFEALRDALLAVAGNLDSKMGGPGVDITTAPFSKRRTIYAFVDRQNLPGVFRTFDFASPDASNPQRYQTTVPQQALYLLNHPFVLQQARIVAKNAGSPATPKEALHRMYKNVYAREPEADELRLGMEFLEQSASVARPADGLTPLECLAQALLVANEFAFVD
ncbi:MAG TPA: PSD1 and planctomycete cytochrome C domain-containing protein [Gemmataceae bacterium]|nr:PSD1 and planctomycete cytochrome C domain-containing protein [Gemmataceae bacterium]